VNWYETAKLLMAAIKNCWSSFELEERDLEHWKISLGGITLPIQESDL